MHAQAKSAGKVDELAGKNARNAMKVMGESAGNFQQHEHDEDLHDLHPQFPEKFQSLQKCKSSNASCISNIQHQESTIISSKINITCMNRAKQKSTSKLKSIGSHSFQHGLTRFKAQSTQQSRIYNISTIKSKIMRINL